MWNFAHRENARSFVAHLKRSRFSFYTGVPCSLLGALIETVEEDPSLTYVPATREDAAVGIAAGAYLAGRRPCVLMQNSGLGYCLNVLTSLNLIYQIPALLIVSYRGEDRTDAPEHWVMGEHCRRIVEEVGIAQEAPDKEGLVPAFHRLDQFQIRERKPAALFIRKGIFGG